MAQEKRTLSPEQIKAIEAALSKGDRVEIMPQKDGVKIVHIRRCEIKI